MRITNPGGSTNSGNATLTVQILQQLTGSVLSNGGFELLSGYADGWSLPASDLARFEIQTSTNLSQGWSTLAASPGILNGQLRVVIPGPASFPTRFLRVVEH